MKIWHLGAASNPYRVDGVSRTVWLIALEQARLGHDVSLVLDDSPTPQALAMAAPVGLKLLDLTASALSYAKEIRALLDVAPPQIVHMHSVFVVRQATLARTLTRYGIPYVITPHGGLAPQVLARGRLKKCVYSAVRERPRFMNAAAIALVTPAEERSVRSFIPEFDKIVRWMPNPVDFALLDPHRWTGPGKDNRLVFLGRFDVLVKGIDILIEIARLLPDVTIDLYGTEDPKTLDWLNRLRMDLPKNVQFHDPIFGEPKAQILSRAKLYIQPSRWEGFPVSVAECLYLGLPASIADTLDLAQLFYEHDLGLVLSLEPKLAANQIREALADDARMCAWSERGREFALQHFAPGTVAGNLVRLYEEVIDSQISPAEPVDAAPGNGHLRSGRGILVPAQMRGLIKQNVSRVFERSGQLFGGNTARTVVLCYHSIAHSDAALSISPAIFSEQMIMLKEMGFEFVNFGDLVHRVMESGSPKTNVVSVTFDDGFEDNYHFAAPILAEHGIPATFFVTTGLMMRDPAVIEQFRALTKFETTYLSPPQATEMERAGFELGTHTHTHPNLGRLAPERARWEIVQSKTVLENATGARVRSFAYPFGKRHIHYTSGTTNLVRESGYSGAASIAFRAVNARSSVRIFEMPRFFVTRADSYASFRQKVAGHFDWLGSFQEASPAWLKSLISPEDRY